MHLQGVSGPYIDSSGKVHGPSVGMPSFHQGSISGGPSINARSIGLSDLANLGGMLGGASNPDAAPNTPGPLSAAGAPVNPQAMSGGMGGATEMFRAPVQPVAQPQAAPTPMGPGEFTRMMQAPPAASAPAVGVPVPQSNQPAQAAPLFSTPVAAPPLAAPAAPAAPTAVPEAAKKGILGMSPLVLVASVVVLIMIVVLIYVMLQAGR
jgi:hypothetical protein